MPFPRAHQNNCRIPANRIISNSPRRDTPPGVSGRYGPILRTPGDGCPYSLYINVVNGPRAVPIFCTVPPCLPHLWGRWPSKARSEGGNCWFSIDKTCNVGNGLCAVPLFSPGWMGTARRPFPTDEKKPHTFVCGQKKKDIHSDVLVLALPIFTARHQATIVSVSELNFCVRDGNRWTLTTINTNSHREAVNLPLYKALSCLFNAPHILHVSFFMCLHASFSW